MIRRLLCRLSHRASKRGVPAQGPECSNAATQSWRAFASAPDFVPLSHPTYQVWGSNTDVGKTLVSAGVFKQACSSGEALFLKPVQTGFPQDSDARLLGAVTRKPTTLGEHAAQLWQGSPTHSPENAATVIHTEFAWETAVSPHLAVELEGRGITDAELLQAVASTLRQYAHNHEGVNKALTLVETAGGPASPGPSGSLQCNLYRALRLPALLVGDGKLGGISTTLAAHEMLSLRGYDVAAIAVIEPETGPNVAAIQSSLASCDGGQVPIFRLPVCSPPREKAAEGAVDPELQQWLTEAQPRLADLFHCLQSHHQERVSRLDSLAERTLASIWYPFTQHTGLRPEDVTVIDARSGEDMLVYKPDEPPGRRVEAQFDACASWWTQGMAGELHGRLVRETMKGVAQYGHVIHPHTATEPTQKLARLLLDSVGRGWASRVFYSDDGSTAVEVALKMAFRKFWQEHPSLDLEGSEGSPVELRVLGIDGGYHGDTLGAMDAVAPSPYNGPAQFPWYKGRGLFLNSPYVGIIKGQWRIKGDTSSDAKGWPSLEALIKDGESRAATAQEYEDQIASAIDEYESASPERTQPSKVAACIIEPLIQGAGGMLIIDPLYQQTLVRVARSRKIPVIFDEVFSGLWRLGHASAAEILGEKPDIACYAKLLTGGLIPMSATLASHDVFEAFQGESKLQALLHGHSYSGHVAGASAGVAALSIFADPSLNPAMQPSGGQLRQLWPGDLVHRLSHMPAVDSVIALGTVLAVELSTGDGGGYASGASAKVVSKLRARGVFARPLGSTVYLMVTPTTLPSTAATLMQSLVSALEEQ